ncbi:hypothetical protein [Mycolicibacterium sp. A43C]
MARATGKDHAEINLDIWGDDDWLDLTPPAQHLYFVLWTSPQLSYCGTGTWHPGRISAVARGWTPAAVETAAVELSSELFLIIDTVTEEFILRSWIKHDGIWKKPNMAVSMANARAALASRILRGVVVHEVTKIKARNEAEALTDPEVTVSSGWQREAVKTLLSQKAIDPASLEPFTPQLTPPPTTPPTPPLNPGPTPGLTLSSGVGVNPLSNPGPTPSPAPATTSILQGGHVSGERHLRVAPNPNDPPSPRCPEHRNNPSTRPCGACGDHREARREWDAAQAAARLAAIAACEACDTAGWVKGPDGSVGPDSTKCTHPDPKEAAHG